MKKKFPNIKFEDEKVFESNESMKEAEIISGKYNFVNMIPFTDMVKYASWGCAADITEQMKRYGYDEMLVPEYLEAVTVNNRIYGLPRWTYHMGLIYNRKIFEEAGLLDEAGYPLYPDTYEELAETAALIKERTGKAGFFFPNTQGQGGWAFMNLAWSFGVEFTKEQDGAVKAAFDTPECVEALQFIKDLKWKYDALPEENFGDLVDFKAMFEKGEVAIGFFSSSELAGNTEKLEDKFNTVAFSKIPRGKSGRYSLRGGTILMFAPEASKEQLDACFLWFDEFGFNDNTDGEAEEKLRNGLEKEKSRDHLVGYADDSVFKSGELYDLRKRLNEEYLNFDYNIIRNFADAEDVTYKMECEYYPQELYRILDIAIQTVVTNENADCAAIIKDANDRFQREYLDNSQY